MCSQYMHEYTLKFMIDNIQCYLHCTYVHCFTLILQIGNSLPGLASFFFLLDLKPKDTKSVIYVVLLVCSI